MSRANSSRADSAFGKRPVWAWLIAGTAILFGVATIISGGAVLFGDAETKAAAGAVVPFVLWFNFLSGFAYVVAGIGLALWKRWGAWLAALIAASILVASAFFAAHVMSGDVYEMRTVMAMTLRAAVWIGIALVGCRALGCIGAQSRAAIEKHRNGDRR
jgi:hypothetical protein